jgi:hypothetical protein
MVLDVSAMTWAKAQNIDTRKLKAAKVPIYGKWYFPDLPLGVPLIDLETGERRTFHEPMVAGEILWAPEAALRRAGVETPEPEPAGEAEATAVALASTAPPVPPPEPLLMMVRPPEEVAEEASPPAPIDPALLQGLPQLPPASAVGIHMPMPSIAPLVLGFGFCLAFLGLITNPIILIVGLAWMLVGAIVWVRVGLLEYAEAHPNAPPPEPAEQL